MADKEKAGAEKAPSKSLVKILMWVFVVATGLGAGFATPLVLMKGKTETAEETSAAEPNEAEPFVMNIPEATEEIAFVAFPALVVNFDDPRISRFLKIEFSLQIAKAQQLEIEKLVEEKQDILRNWLIGHTADKKLEDLRGKQAHNRFRREIHDQFNLLLFPDGVERIQDVLFKELNVQ